MRSRERKTRHAVVKRSRIPTLRRVTVGAICQRKRRSRRGVHWIVRLLPCRQMAARISARRRRNIQRIVVVDVARCTRNVRVAIGQRKAECRVIEFPVSPCRDRMAGSARRRSRWESRRNVVRHISAKCRRTLPGGLVTTHAVRRVQRVIVADMARRARSRRRRHVRSGERKPRHAVVERSSVPTFRCVAIRAVGQRKGGP